MKRSAHMGFTLPELLISILMLAIILTICTTIFISAWRRYHIVNVIDDVETSAFIGVERVSRDARETSRNFIGYDSTSKSLYFPSPRDMAGAYYYGPDMVSSWQTWMIYYLYPDPQHSSLYYLARKQRAGDLSSPPAIYSEITNLDDASIVARNVYDFEVLLSPPERNSLEVKLDTRADFKGKACTFTARKTIFVNQRVTP